MADRIRVSIEGDSADLRHAVLLAERSLRDLSREVAKQNAEQRAFAAGSNDVVRSLQRVEQQVRRTDSSHQRLGRTLATIGWGSLAVGIGPAVSALTSLTAGAIALTSALGPLVGVLATVPQGLAAFGQGIGVAALAIQPVIAALKAMETAHKTSGQAAASNANAQRDAAQRIVTAKEQIAVAERNETDAELQLHDARQQAVRDLQDLENQSKDTVLAEQRAHLTLKDAETRLRQAQVDPLATSRDLTDARLTVAEARRRLTEAKQEHRRAAQDFKKADTGGIDKMPQVAAAIRQVEDAQRAQTDASRQLAAAQADATQAMQHQSAAATDLQQKLANLSPAARAFVDDLKSMEGAFHNTQRIAQQGLFPGLKAGFDSAKALIPTVNKIVGDTSRELGKLASQAGKALATPRWQHDIATLGRQNVHLIDDMGVSFGHLVSALDNVMIAAGPLTRWLADTVTGWTKQLDKWTEAKRKSGELKDFFHQTKVVLSEVFDIAKNFAGVLVHIAQAAAPLGKTALDGLDHLVQHLNEWSRSPGGQKQLGDFFSAAKAPLRDVAHLAGDLLKDLLKLGQDGAPALARVARILDKQFLPPLSDLAHAVTVDLLPHLLGAANSLGKLFKAVEPGIKALIPPLNTLLDAIKAVLDFITKVTNALPGVAKLAPSLLVGGAVIKSWQTLKALIRDTAALQVATGGAPIPGGKGGGKGGVKGLIPSFLGAGAATQLGIGAVGTTIVVVGAANAGSALHHQFGTGGGAALGSQLAGPLGGPVGAISGAGGFDFAVGPQDVALKDFSDRVKKMAPELQRLGNSRGLIELGREADQLAAKFPQLATKFHAAGDALRKEAAQIASGAIGKLKQSVEGTKFHSEKGIFADLQHSFATLGPAGRQAGANAMIELARSFERNGTAPKGTTRRLIAQIESQYPELVPFLRRTGHDSMSALATALKDRRVVDAVKNQIADISHTWDDAPKLAATNAGNARKNWLAEMEFLREKLRTTHGKMHDEAKAAYERLSKLGPAAARVERHDMLRVQGDLRGKWKDGLDKLITGSASQLGVLNAVFDGGLQGINSAFNAALKALGVKPVDFGVTAKTEQSFINKALSQARSHNAQGGLHQFGDPNARGRDSIPVDFGASKIMVAPGELGAVFTGEQQQVVNEALVQAKGIPGLSGLFRTHTTEHERTRRYAKGGVASGYVYPVPGFTFAGIDEGVDFSGAGNIGAIGRAKMLRVAPQHSGTGWPGAGDGGHGNNGAMITYRLLDGPRAGRIVYTAENVDPLVHSGALVNAGQAIAHARGAFPYLETGWSDAHGTPLAHGHYVNHQPTPEGRDFWAFLNGLAHGKITGGKGALGAIAQFKALKKLQVTGPAGAQRSLLQGGFDKVVAAANAYGRKQQATAAAASTTSGGSIPAFSGSWPKVLHRIAQAKGWSEADWRWIIAHESSGNPAATNGNHWGLGQLDAGAGGRPGDPADVQIRKMAAYIQGRYGNPTAAKSFWLSHNWYEGGGIVAGEAGIPGTAAKGGVHAAASQHRLRAAMNAAELFWSHTSGYHRFSPNIVEGRIRYAQTGLRGEVNPSRTKGWIDPGYASGATWEEFCRTVAHEAGHLTNRGHSPNIRSIMKGQIHGNMWKPSVPWPAKIMGEGAAYALGHPIKGPGNGAVPFPASKTPAWYKGGSGGSGGGSSGGGGGSNPHAGQHWIAGHWETSGGKGAKYDKHQNPYGSIWSAGEYSGLAHAVGLSKHEAVTAGAIAMAETAPHGKFASIGDGGHSRGPWQIYDLAHSYNHHKALTDPWYTAGLMKSISGGGSNWAPWSTWKNGAYRSFMGAAAHLKPYLGKRVGGSGGRRHWVKGHWSGASGSSGAAAGDFPAGSFGARVPGAVKGSLRYISPQVQKLLRVAMNKGRALAPWMAIINKWNDQIDDDDKAFPHLEHLVQTGKTENGKSGLALEIENRKDQLQLLLGEQGVAGLALPGFKGQIKPLRGKYDKVAAQVNADMETILKKTGKWPKGAKGDDFHERPLPHNSPKPGPSDYGPDGEVTEAFARRQVLRDFPGAKLGKADKEPFTPFYRNETHPAYAIDVLLKDKKTGKFKLTGETVVDRKTGQVLEYEINDKKHYGDRKPVGGASGQTGDYGGAPTDPRLQMLAALAKGKGHVSQAYADRQARRQFPGAKIVGRSVENEAPHFHPNQSHKVYAFDMSGGGEVLVDYYTGQVLQWEKGGTPHDGDRFPSTAPGKGGSTGSTGSKGTGGKSTGKGTNTDDALRTAYADMLVLTGHKTLGTDPTTGKVTDYWLHHADGGSVLGRITNELDSRIAARDALEGLMHDLAFVSPAGTVGGSIQDKRDEIDDLISQSSSAQDNSALADLYKTQAEQNAANLRLSETTLGTFKGFPFGQLGGLGGFAHGIRNIPRQGFELLHPGETVLPAPDGPYGHQLRPYPDQQVAGQAAAPIVNITLQSDPMGVVKVVRAEIDGRAASVANQRIGRDSRTLSIAPGR